MISGIPTLTSALRRDHRGGRRLLGVALGVLLAVTGCTTGAQTGSPATSRATSHAATSTVTMSQPSTLSTPPPPRTVTIIASGDVLIHPPLWEQAHADAIAAGTTGYDFGPMYASVVPDVRAADVAICEMETPLAPAGGPFRGWPDFNAPPQVLTALKGAGYDSCTTASNHTLDQGFAGVKRTLDALDAATLLHTGSARSAAEAAQQLIITTAQGVRVGQLAYSFGFNGIAKPTGMPWIANQIDVPTILASAHAIKQAGADIVVLSLHWGTEYDHLATDQQREQAQQLLASPDIDVILGDHAHVVQPMQRINGKWVIYCMGNQISRHADPIAEGREGVMPRFTFTETTTPGHFAVTKAEAIPTWMQDEPALRLLDIPRALADPATPAATHADLERAYTAIRGYLDAYGAVSDGLAVLR